MTRDARLRLLAALLLLAVSSCAPAANELAGAAVAEERLPGFWLGLWHGFISFFTFVVSLFRDDVGVYAVRNSGSWYDFGFLLGVMIFYGGGSGQARQTRSEG